jgi:hypothetical protein
LRNDRTDRPRQTVAWCGDRLDAITHALQWNPIRHSAPHACATVLHGSEGTGEILHSMWKVRMRAGLPAMHVQEHHRAIGTVKTASVFVLAMPTSRSLKVHPTHYA